MTMSMLPTTVVADRYVDTRYGVARVTLAKLPAAQGGYFETTVTVEGNIGQSGPIPYVRNHIADYAVDMWEALVNNLPRLEDFILTEVLY